MAANSSLQITELEFQSIKQGFIEYMRQQDHFKDFDFEGSNVNLLFDILAYNTYTGSFYNNMALSESFLDSAQRWDSVASHAKSLNYLPRSFHSSEARVDFSITMSDTDSTRFPNSIELPLHSGFKTKIGSKNYGFYTTDTHLLPITNRSLEDGTHIITYGKTDVPISEGIIVNEYFVVDANVYQKFTLSNYDVDTDTLIVKVRESRNSENYDVYQKTNSLFEHKSDSPIYFLEPARGQKYELSFGNGVVGKLPVQGNIVEVTYLKSSGDIANGARQFTYSGENVNGFVGTVSVNTRSVSQGGSDHENIDSIKFFAPKSRQLQERAVTDDDTETLMLQTFPEIEAISSFSGGELNPPEYGKRIISIDLKNADGISQTKIDQFTQFLKKRVPTTIRVKIINPDFTFIQANVQLELNPRLTNKSPGQIHSNVVNAIEQFGKDYVNKFKTVLPFSRLIRTIDSVDVSIVSNETEIKMFKKIRPGLNFSSNFELDFQNKLKSEIIDTTSGAIDISNYEPAIRSNGFIVNGINVFMMDDGQGNIHLLTRSNIGTIIYTRNVGKVNYQTGEMEVSFFAESYTGDAINVYASPFSNNVKSEKNVILSLQKDYVDVNSINT